MSNTTSEERREAATNLRKIHLGGANKDLMKLMLSDAIGAWHENGISWDYITERLAALIDPATSTTTFTPEESPIPLPVRLWVCARCGEEVIMMNDEGEPMACPYCKAVVADDD